jgi:hypothetical protein
MDMRMFELQYEAGEQVNYGSISEKISSKKPYNTIGLARTSTGQFKLTLYDKGLRSPQDAVETIAHELNHVRGFLQTGATSTEGSAEAAAEAAAPFVR